MKKLLLSVFVVALSVITVFAQAPEKLNYQGVARDNAGNVLATQPIGLQVKVHSGSGSGPVVYSETHATTTNAFGLFNVQIGTGGNQSGTIAAIDWGGNSYYVEVGLDASGGTSYTSMGNQQLLSVPYALYAKAADNASGTTNYVSKFTAANTLGNSQIFDNGVSVGIGTTSPTGKLEIASDGSLTGGLRISNTGATVGPSIYMKGQSKSWTISATNSSAVAGANKLIFRDYSSAADRMAIDASGNVGIGTTAPTYKLDVNHSGSTGIRSRSTSGYSVVDIDAADGDAVIRFYKAGAGMWLIGNHYANDNFRIYELGTSTERLMIERTSGNVGVGTSTPVGKLDVVANAGLYAGHFTNSNAGGSAYHVIHGEATHTGSSDVIGVYGQNTVEGYYGYGVRGTGGWYGVRGEAAVAGTGTRYGTYGYAAGTSGTSYGIFGAASGSGTNYAGYFSGDVYSSGSYLPSDANLKSNIKDYSSAMALLSDIPVKSYTYRNDGIYGQMHLPVGQQVGIMAQDLELVFPQLVKANHFEDVESYEQGLVSKEDMESIDFKAVNYTGLVPILVKAMQEQNQKIETQQLLIEQLLQRIEALEAK